MLQSRSGMGTMVDAANVDRERFNMSIDTPASFYAEVSSKNLDKGIKTIQFIWEGEAEGKQKNTAMKKKWYVFRLEARPSLVINGVWFSREIQDIA